MITITLKTKTKEKQILKQNEQKKITAPNVAATTKGQSNVFNSHSLPEKIRENKL